MENLQFRAFSFVASPASVLLSDETYPVNISQTIGWIQKNCQNLCTDILTNEFTPTVGTSKKAISSAS